MSEHGSEETCESRLDRSRGAARCMRHPELRAARNESTASKADGA